MAIALYDQSPSPLGSSIWKFTGVVAPAQFVPTLTEVASRNKAGSNVNYRVKVSYPLASKVNDVWSAPNIITASFTLTALQNVMSEAETLRVIDETIAHLTVNRKRIAAGSLTAVPA